MLVARGRIGDIEWRACAACLLGAALFGATSCGINAQYHPVALPTGTTFSVLLTTDRNHYGINQPIGVTVQNTSATTYYAADSQSACTIVQLQQLIKSDWQNVMPCTTGQSPTVLLIAPRSSVPLTFAPGNTNDDPNAWQPGTYRVALPVLTKPDSSGPMIQIYSAAFQVS